MLPVIVSALRNKMKTEETSEANGLSTTDWQHQHGERHDHHNDGVYLHHAPYAKERLDFNPKYNGSCYCGAITFDIADEPLDASYCHCYDCQRLHGTPFQWAAILPKDAVLFTQGLDKLCFYNCQKKSNSHELPCKVYCSQCHSPLADEGRNMMLVMPVAIHFPDHKIPDSFRATHHMFYGSRVEDVHDGIPKFLGKKGDKPYEESQ